MVAASAIKVGPMTSIRPVSCAFYGVGAASGRCADQVSRTCSDERRPQGSVGDQSRVDDFYHPRFMRF